MRLSPAPQDCRRPPRALRRPAGAAALLRLWICLPLLGALPLAAQQAATLPPASASTTPSSASSQPPPSREEMRALLERVIATTHRSDAAEAEYARTEHWIERRHAGDASPVLDRVYRVYPTGTGTLKVMLVDSGVQVTPERYREELRELEQDLVRALDPEEPRQQASVVKWKKRTAERYRAVEAFRDAYDISWLGFEHLPNFTAPRPLDKLLLDPKRGSAPGSIATELLAASRITLWVDPGSGAVVQLDAELVRDLRFGGGLLGKIDKGGRVHIEQTEVAPGIWLPALISNQVKGRKFLSHQESVRTVVARDHRRVGPPSQLLPEVRRQLSNPNLQVPAP
jgi:hypothetical protein